MVKKSNINRKINIKCDKINETSININELNSPIERKYFHNGL